MGSESDDIDAGWDEAPASAPLHAAAGSVPAPSVSSSFAPASSTETPFEAIPLVTRRPGAYTSSESLSPTEVAAPLSRAEPRTPSRWGPVVVLGALAAATVLWFGHAPKADSSHASTAARFPSEPIAAVAPAPVAPAAAPVVPAPAPVVSATAPSPVSPGSKPTAADSLQLEPLVLEASNRVGVTVQSVPEGAVFFEAGQRLGTTQVRINVLHQTKRHLTALLNGYQPLNFKVDGKSEAVTVRLTPVAAAAAPTAPVAAAAATPAPQPAPESPPASP